MLEKLTQAQEELMIQVRDERLSRFFDLPQINQEQASRFANYLYNLSGLDSPVTIVVDSPLGLQVEANHIWEHGTVSTELGDQVLAQVRAQARDQVRAQVRDQVGDQVLAQVRDQVDKANMTLFDFGMYGDIRCYGWNSFYDFFERIGVVQNSKFNEYIEMNRGVFMTIQLEGFCLISRNPIKLTRDDKGRMHNTEGYAIEFGDGYGQYYIHGVSFGEADFTRFRDGSLTPKDIINRGNQDQKRAMLMEVDYKQLLKDLGSKKIDSSIDGNNSQMNLYQIDLGDDESPALFYEAIDPSKNETVILRVHPTEVTTCMEAKLRTRKFLRDKYKEGNKISFIQET